MDFLISGDQVYWELKRRGMAARIPENSVCELSPVGTVSQEKKCSIDADRQARLSQAATLVSAAKFFQAGRLPSFELGNKMLLAALLEKPTLKEQDVPGEIFQQVITLRNRWNQLPLEQKNNCKAILLSNGFRSDILSEDAFLWECEQTFHSFLGLGFIVVPGRLGARR